MELRDYIDVIYNRKWLLIVTVVVILFVTLLVSFLQSAVYESSAKVFADVNTSSEALLGDLLSTGTTDMDRFIQNQIEIVKTEVLAEAVERQLEYEYEQKKREKGKSKNMPEKIPNAEELQEMVSVRAGAKTGIFEIVVTGGDPVLTRDVAQTYADEYLSNRQLAAIAQISEARKEVWNRVMEVEEQLKQVADQSKQYKSNEVPTELVAAAQQSAALWATLYEKYMTLRISESLEQRGLEIIEPARLGEKVGPKVARNGVLALFIGLILGLGLVFFVDYMDDTLHTREDFEKCYDTMIIGEIPFIKGEELPEHHIVYFEKPNHLAVEGYRTLRTNLQFLNLKEGKGSILFTSSLPGEGKSTIMVNLGSALSEMGKRVLLIEADMRKPALKKFFDIEVEEGLTNVLAGNCSLEKAIYETGYENLYLVPLGVRPPNPGELAASEHMRKMIEQAKELFDFVLVDAPPVLATNDALAIAPVVDGVIVIGRYEIAERDGAKRTMEMLNKVEANILGLVINNLEAGRRYGYYHYYYYDYRGDRQEPKNKWLAKMPWGKEPKRAKPED